MQDFQAFTVKFPGKMNVLFSNIGVSSAFDPNVTTNNPPQIHDTQAIWDTGASCSVISRDFAALIGLIPTGKTKITGVNHTTEENTYLVNVYLPNSVCIGYVKVAEVPALSGGSGMLIGMDIIGSGDFSVYTEDDKTVMTYRFPSVGGIDFCEEAEKIKTGKIAMQQLVMQQHQRKPLSQKEQFKRRMHRKNKKHTKRK